jgi:hypothetical protein
MFLVEKERNAEGKEINQGGQEEASPLTLDASGVRFPLCFLTLLL